METTFRRHEKVMADIDLPGVPAGTPGKVLLPTGITWQRYRVLFENGIERGSLDTRHLVRPKDYIPFDERVVVEADESAATDEAEAEGDGAAAAADNPYGVPPHLLERSKRARERLAAG